MSNAINTYINKDDYSLFINDMRTSEISRNDKTVSKKTMYFVLFILVIILITTFILTIIYFLYIFNKTFPSIVVFILLILIHLYIFFKILYISHKISIFIENNLLFNI